MWYGWGHTKEKQKKKGQDPPIQRMSKGEFGSRSSPPPPPPLRRLWDRVEREGCPWSHHLRKGRRGSRVGRGEVQGQYMSGDGVSDPWGALALERPFRVRWRSLHSLHWSTIWPPERGMTWAAGANPGELDRVYWPAGATSPGIRGIGVMYHSAHHSSQSVQRAARRGSERVLDFYPGESWRLHWEESQMMRATFQADKEGQIWEIQCPQIIVAWWTGDGVLRGGERVILSSPTGETWLHPFRVKSREASACSIYTGRA